METSEEVMHIVELQVENVKRIKALHIKFDENGEVVVIGGRNAQGKSSVIDAIWYCLGGPKVECENVIKDGEDSGFVKLDLGRYQVIRTWYRDKNQTLKVTENGVPVKSQQTVLNGLLAPFTCDPMEFMRMGKNNPKKQFEILREMTGVNFDALDGQRARVYSERADVNVETKHLRMKLIELGPHDRSAPKELVDDRKLLERYDRSKDAAAQQRASASRLEALQKRLQETQAELEACAEEIDAQGETENAGDLKQQIADASVNNKKFRLNEERRETTLKASDSLERSEAFTAEIKKIDETKKEILASVDFPVEGLSFTDGRITFNGQNLDQCSQAEQIKISTAIAISGNKTLRVMFIRDASLLDKDSVRQVSELASAARVQLFLEVVGTDGAMSIVIEDGAVVGGSLAARQTTMI